MIETGITFNFDGRLWHASYHPFTCMPMKGNHMATFSDELARIHAQLDKASTDTETTAVVLGRRVKLDGMPAGDGLLPLAKLVETQADRALSFRKAKCHVIKVPKGGNPASATNYQSEGTVDRDALAKSARALARVISRTGTADEGEGEGEGEGESAAESRAKAPPVGTNGR